MWAAALTPPCDLGACGLWYPLEIASSSVSHTAHTPLCLPTASRRAPQVLRSKRLFFCSHSVIRPIYAHLLRSAPPDIPLPGPVFGLGTEIPVLVLAPLPQTPRYLSLMSLLSPVGVNNKSALRSDGATPATSDRPLTVPVQCSFDDVGQQLFGKPLPHSKRQLTSGTCTTRKQRSPHVSTLFRSITPHS